ncbi:MAG: hypothetical protein M1825_002830 [Sarcosagium campestre]|nr:MAG: hypothetical protein M1825_002830 [Sarcosagium campestre]
MDHGSLGHGSLSHAGMDHGGMEHGGMKCSMNMLFTWNTENLCIVFSGWRITSTISLILSLVAIVLITATYELLRDYSRRYELRLAQRKDTLSGETLKPKRCEVDDRDESSSLLSPGTRVRGAREDGKLVKAALYAVQVFYSFFIMLLFMTYNGWVMLAVAVGAFVGYVVWGNSSASKSVACH